MELNIDETKQLAATFGCEETNLDSQIAKYSAAAQEEYVRMILGQRVFTRGRDILEYRLYLLIKNVFDGRLPSDQQISSLFQTTTTQSRGLLRAVMSKYQYELQDAIRGTLREVLRTARNDPNSDDHLIIVDSENVIESLNRQIIAIDGTLRQVTKLRNSASTYVIAADSYTELVEHLK
jgi:hypothetical protein